MVDTARQAISRSERPLTATEEEQVLARARQGQQPVPDYWQFSASIVVPAQTGLTGGGASNTVWFRALADIPGYPLLAFTNDPSSITNTTHIEIDPTLVAAGGVGVSTGVTSGQLRVDLFADAGGSFNFPGFTATIYFHWSVAGIYKA